MIQKTFDFFGLMRRKLNFLEVIHLVTSNVTHKKNLILTVKHGGVSVIVWGCTAFSGLG